MTTGLACTMVLTAQLAAGGLGLFDCLKKDRHEHDYIGPECCHSCLSEYRRVENLLVVMQRHPSWKERDDAAHELRDFDWRCHPEMVPALAYTMLEDCHEEVREEAAETLAKLAPRDGTAHVAFRQAALTDPDHATRKWARRGLDRIDGRCLTDCALCGPLPVPGPSVVAAPTEYELDVLPPSRGPRIYGEVPIDRGATPYGAGRLMPVPPPGAGGASPIDPGAVPPPGAVPDPYGLGSPAPFAPDAPPGLLPPALSPGGGPVEVVPPELPPPVPPAVSPFGASRRPAEPASPSRRGGPVLLFTVGRR